MTFLVITTLAHMTNRVALFRFHKTDYEDHLNRIALLKMLNPLVPIYGLFGGEEKHFEEVVSKFKDVLEDVTFLTEADPYMKWSGGDVACQQWFNEVGRNIDFEVLHVVEWDLLYMVPFDVWYSHIPAGALGCTGLMPLRIIEDKWFWTSNEKQRLNWARLLEFAKEKYNYNYSPYAMQGPAISYPRGFLEKLSTLEIPRMCIDELRIPLVAQILGFPLVDNKVYNWFSIENNIAFNCNRRSVQYETIKKELSFQNGFRVFHPYTDIVDLNSFSRLFEQEM